jgi:homoserine O-acetyltransferase/O-succinyltransferase
MSAPRLLRQRVPRFRLESGRVLEDIEQAYTLTGRLNAARDNVIVVFHSLTGDADPLGWWPELVGPGLTLDTGRYAVLCANLLGSCYGTTPLPAAAAVTPRDMARLTRRLLAELRVESVQLATGGSLGGMVTLEWVATYPALTRAAVVFAAPAAHSAQAIAFNHIQRRAIELGGDDGLALARMAAMLTYRTGAELEQRFGRAATGDRFEVQRYLDYHGERLVRRFDRAAYVKLLDAMDAHDVGRGRGGVAAALAAFTGYLLGIGIPGDVLYPDDEVRAWTDAAGCDYAVIDSIRGHDAFLLEPDQAAALLARGLQHAARRDGRVRAVTSRHEMEIA